jgi:fucose 4-O-acetylase-like acetyltransferase
MKNDTISISKGIAIILMVIGHSGCPQWLFDFIYEFHMPLFFFVSGYCLKEKYIDAPRLFVERKITTLYKPFVIWSSIFLVLHNFFYHLNVYNSVYGVGGGTSLDTFSDFIQKELRILLSMDVSEQLLGGYWFIKELFLASIISLFIIRWVPKKYLTLQLLVAIIVTFILKFFNLYIPFFGIDSLTFFSVFFFLFGFLLSKHNIFNSLFIFPLFVIVAIFSIKCPCDMLRYDSHSVFIYSFASILGVILILNVSKILADKSNRLKKILIFYGDNTLQILTWHLLSFKIVSLFVIFLLGRDIKQLGCTVVRADFFCNERYSSFWILYTIVGVTLPFTFIYLKRYRKSSSKKNDYC